MRGVVKHLRQGRNRIQTVFIDHASPGARDTRPGNMVVEEKIVEILGVLLPYVVGRRFQGYVHFRARIAALRVSHALSVLHYRIVIRIAHFLDSR